MNCLSQIRCSCLYHCKNRIKFPSRQRPSFSRFHGSKDHRIESWKESVVTGPKEFVVDTFGDNPAFLLESGKRTDLNSSPNVLAFSGIAGLRNDVIDSIESMGISQPTVIQLKGIPMILKGRNVLCAAQTGSGKTLTYLVPILNILKDEEDSGFMTKFNHPRACIVAPFRELAAQILQVVKSMSHHVSIRSVGCIGGEKDSIMYKRLKERPVDILVGTPGTILDLLRKRRISFLNLRYMVFDEADTMYDSSFKGITDQLLKSALPNAGGYVKGRHRKFVFAAATLPRHGVLNHIKDSIKDISLVTANLHHILPNIQYHFIKTLQPEKPKELLTVLSTRISTNRKVLIFVNTSSTCNWLSGYLSEKGVSHGKLSGKTSPEDRRRILREFKSKENGIVISTDLTSRGLDFPDLHTVINYDCPLNTTDFIHRAGRTGRARAEYVGTPVVYTLLSRNWEVSLARKVQIAAEKRKAISDVHVIKRGQDAAQVIDN